MNEPTNRFEGTNKPGLGASIHTHRYICTLCIFTIFHTIYGWATAKRNTMKHCIPALYSCFLFFFLRTHILHLPFDSTTVFLISFVFVEFSIFVFLFLISFVLFCCKTDLFFIIFPMEWMVFLDMISLYTDEQSDGKKLDTVLTQCIISNIFNVCVCGFLRAF